MDKIDKLLKKLSSKERDMLVDVLTLLYTGEISTLNIKKLRGHQDIFRVRVQDLRIIFRRIDNEILVLEISRRNEKTYRNY